MAVTTEYFDRARDLMLLQAQNPAFAEFYSSPGARTDKICRRRPAPGREAVQSLAYLESLYGGRIGEICFIDRSGGENARAPGAPRPRSATCRSMSLPTRSSRQRSSSASARCTRPPPTSHRIHTTS